MPTKTKRLQQLRLVEITEANHELPIPYPAISRSYRDEEDNYGYFDTRGRPDLIDQIPEVKGWPELATFLKRMNDPESPYESLGCAMWVGSCSFKDQPSLKTRICSYVDIYRRGIERSDTRNFCLNLATKMDDFLWHDASNRYMELQHKSDDPLFIKVEATLQPISFGDIWWGLTLWVNGFGQDELQARARWACCLNMVADFLLQLDA